MVGTHGTDIHAGVKALLTEAGLVLEHEHSYNANTEKCDETARTGRQVTVHVATAFEYRRKKGVMSAPPFLTVMFFSRARRRLIQGVW